MAAGFAAPGRRDRVSLSGDHAGDQGCPDSRDRRRRGSDVQKSMTLESFAYSAHPPGPARIFLYCGWKT
jgi:hypothetical protein